MIQAFHLLTTAFISACSPLSFKQCSFNFVIQFCLPPFLLAALSYQPWSINLSPQGSHHIAHRTSCSPTSHDQLTHSPCSKDTCLPCCQSSMAIGHKHCSDNILSLTGIIGPVCLGAVRLWKSGQSFLGLPAAISNT